MARLVLFNLFLFAFLAFAIALAARIAGVGDADVFTMQRAAPPPAGMIYKNYCDGMPSPILAPIGDDACVADRPGAFSRHAVAPLFVLGLLAGNALFGFLWLRRRAGARTP